ncbi:MAG: hypothetical protein DSM106950_38360 [Stigonema ocellatum SAG 48.90 = DSM 106950]|nr:hypothetical protein [Stigonema ocellatum SAG 48.90 = DSM 106950]
MTQVFCTHEQLHSCLSNECYVMKFDCICNEHRADTWAILPIDSTQQQADQKLSLSCGVTIPPSA